MLLDLHSMSPGSQAFLPSLLSYIHGVAAPASLPLDPVVFQSILLCLIARDKHLILRTPNEDVGLVVKLAHWTLSSIFNLPTHRLKIKTRSPTRSNVPVSIDTCVFLRSLFLPQDEGFADASSKRANHPRQTRHTRYKHSHGSMSDSLLMSDSIHIPEFSASSSPSVLRRSPVYPNLLPHSYSDPLPARQNHPLQLPNALVLSGLEYAPDLTQRTFARVLAEKTVTLVAAETNSEINETGSWILPDGFITVYVCPLDAQERPPIHKTLLDKFAMSSNIFVSQDIRHAFRALPFFPSPHPHFPSHSNPTTPSPSHSTSLPQTHTPPIFTKPLPLYPSPFNPPPLPKDILPFSFLKTLRDAHHKTHMSHTLFLYLADIFSATRHNSRLDATLLTARAIKDAEALIRASRVIGADLTGMELLRPMVQADDFSDSVGSHKVEPQRNPTLPDETASGIPQVLDVSEVDVARIAPRVISHRIRVRDGPEDEILSSALFGATFKPKGTTGTDGGSNEILTVKSLLVQILSEV